jgi:hypothetical protein
VSEDQDWRLTAELDAGDKRGTLDRLLGRVRGGDVVEEIEGELPHDVVITHDGKMLFAYAASEAATEATRRVIEQVLQRDGVGAEIVVSHWDGEFDEWRQVDPPLSAEQARSEAAAELDAEAVQTRTLVASAGNLVRSSFEQSLIDWGQNQGLKVTVAEHPHVLSTQVLFTVTGPKHKIEEFERALRAEGTAFVRADATLLVSPF